MAREIDIRLVVPVLPLLLVIFVLGFGGPLATPASAGRSCGTVSAAGGGDYRVTITKGAPSCRKVRHIASRYGRPKAVRYNCSPRAHLCAYGVYPGGWRCTGLFQGTFGCWLGGNSKGKNARQSFRGENVY